MKKVFKPALFVLLGSVLAGAGTYFYVQAQSDTVTASVTVPATLTIADDGVNLSIANLTPETIDATQSNTLTVSSNDPDGFAVQLDLEDLDATAGQLCEDDTSGNCTANLFDGDGANTYVSFTSDAGAGTLGGLTGATFTAAETKLGAAGSYQAFTATDPTNSNTFDVDYDVRADNTVVPATYEGTLTFTIVAQ